MPNIEQTFNYLLADVLREKNPRWKDNGDSLVAEAKGSLPGKKLLQPDLLLQEKNGSILVIETEFDPARTVEKDAKDRFKNYPSTTSGQDQLEHVIALHAPVSIKEANQTDLPLLVRNTHYEYCLFSLEEDTKEPRRWPKKGLLMGTADNLADLMECCIVSERLISKTLEALENGVEDTAKFLSKITSGNQKIGCDIAKVLHQADGLQTRRMAMAIMANALTFQTILEGQYGIPTFSKLMRGHDSDFKRVILDVWNYIIDNVNYWPIFSIAREVLDPIPTQTASKILKRLVSVSGELAASGVTRSHDLSGRMFQRLISDRKFLATFYTRPSAACLLAELSVSRLPVDWAIPESVKQLKIGDLACGTGTLLTAAYQSVQSRHRRAKGDDQKLHKEMMEKSLFAMDIMPAATHLTTSMLSSTHPTETFTKTSVFTLPYGKPNEPGLDISIGSLDLLDKNFGLDLFGTETTIASGKMEARKIGSTDSRLPIFSLENNFLDLVIMNPPFTCPTNHKITNVPVPSFAGFKTSEEEQVLMSKKLAKIKQKLDRPAGHGNAGLASNFIDLADAKVRQGGILALVLPLAFAQGKSWQAARDLLNRNYEEIIIISTPSEKAIHTSFSADTNMGEVLLIAKRKNQSNTTPPLVTFVALKERPANNVLATQIARSIDKTLNDLKKVDLLHSSSIKVGNDLIGSAIRADLKWGGCAAVVELNLAKTSIKLSEGRLMLPQNSKELDFPMTKLKNLGKPGFVHRDINGINPDGKARGPFDIEHLEHGVIPEYPVLWNHDASREHCFVVRPDSLGIIRENMEEKASKVWQTATQLHLNLDFNLSSASLGACLTPEICLGGCAWPNYQLNLVSYQEVLVLWCNTTLGLLSFWFQGSKQHPGRARNTISRLSEMPVLDLRTLTRSKVEKAKRIFLKFKKLSFLPANEAYRDETRKELDEEVLVNLLGIPSSYLNPLSLLRRQWCSEPSVHGGKRTRIRT